MILIMRCVTRHIHFHFTLICTMCNRFKISYKSPTPFWICACNFLIICTCINYYSIDRPTVHVIFPLVFFFYRKVAPPEEKIITSSIPEEEEMEVAKPSPPQVPSRWVKFNDTIVEEFVFTDAVLEAECFGGTIKTTSSDPSKYAVCACIYYLQFVQLYINFPIQIGYKICVCRNVLPCVIFLNKK